MMEHFLQMPPLLAPGFLQDVATHSKMCNVGAFLLGTHEEAMPFYTTQ